MKFKSHNSVSGQECETELKRADSNTSSMYIQTWVPSFIMKTLKDPKFGYRLFRWEQIIKLSTIQNSKMQCFEAVTDAHLDGLLCIRLEKTLKVEFIATAPWNYKENGIMRGIGSGMIYYAIKLSNNNGFNGEYFLNALPDAEQFYDKIGMNLTGNVNSVGLKEYRMPPDQASKFVTKFKKLVIEE